MITTDQPLDVIVADDNAVLASVLCDIFRECGYVVRIASDGFAALTEIGRKVPDILVSDLCMPRMSGYELLSVVRRRFPSIRVVAMSGAHSAADVPTGVAADAFYAKGVSSVTQLCEIVYGVYREAGRTDRPPTPVWISNHLIDDGKDAHVLICCPECLRPFSHWRDATAVQQVDAYCPHCLLPVEIAVVRSSQETDGTPLSLPTAQVKVSPFPTTNRMTHGFTTGWMQGQ